MGPSSPESPSARSSGWTAPCAGQTGGTAPGRPAPRRRVRTGRPTQTRPRTDKKAPGTIGRSSTLTVSPRIRSDCSIASWRWQDSWWYGLSSGVRPSGPACGCCSFRSWYTVPGEAAEASGFSAGADPEGPAPHRQPERRPATTTDGCRHRRNCRVTASGGRQEDSERLGLRMMDRDGGGAHRPVAVGIDGSIGSNGGTLNPCHSGLSPTCQVSGPPNMSRSKITLSGGPSSSQCPSLVMTPRAVKQAVACLSPSDRCSRS